MDRRKKMIDYTHQSQIMRKLLTLAMLSACLSAEGQINTSKFESLSKFFRFRDAPSGFRSARAAPNLRSLTDGSPSQSYWEVLSYTSYSENGRIRSIHSFDANGRLRETRTSFSLRKKGPLSNCRVQFSSRQTRPFLVFMIR